MQSFKTIQIPRQVRGKPGAWDPSICLDWGRRFLAFLRSAITSQSSASHRSVWRVRFSPSDGVSVSPLDEGGVEIVQMSPAAAQIASAAYARYGKGVGRPGVLNLGDCLAYGVAQALGEPLLFKGDDFAATDVRAAPY